MDILVDTPVVTTLGKGGSVPRQGVPHDGPSTRLMKEPELHLGGLAHGEAPFDATDYIRTRCFAQEYRILGMPE
jgi:hypothetical protein